MMFVRMKAEVNIKLIRVSHLHASFSCSENSNMFTSTRFFLIPTRFVGGKGYGSGYDGSVRFKGGGKGGGGYQGGKGGGYDEGRGALVRVRSQFRHVKL